MNKYYVYRHLTEDTKEVFYIGKGCGDRVKRKYLSHRSKEWHKVSSDGYTTEILSKDLSEEDAYELEELLIKEYGRKDLKLGNLVNKTNGGAGPKGVIVSQETRDKMVESWKNRLLNMTQETRDKMSKRLSERLTGVMLSNEHKKKISKNMIGVSKSIEHCDNQTKAALSRSLESRDSKTKQVVNCRGQVFSSINKASKHFKHSNNNAISDCCKGKREYGGWYLDGTLIKWEFVDSKFIKEKK